MSLLTSIKRTSYAVKIGAKIAEILCREMEIKKADGKYIRRAKPQDYGRIGEI